MSDRPGKVIGFCCNYTTQVTEEPLKEAGILPESVEFKRLSCTGKLEVSSLLAAFSRHGADAVFVAGCPEEECHNFSGSRRASKRVKYTKQILSELGIEPERIEMFFVPRQETEPVVKAAKEMLSRLEKLGPIIKKDSNNKEGNDSGKAA